jgi:hypothetical protein
MAGDESWFLQHHNYQQRECRSAHKILTRVAPPIAALQTMFRVFLRIQDAIFIVWFPPGERFNSGYFCEKILEPLSQVLHSGCAGGSPRPIVHFENTTLHRSPVTENCSKNCQFRHPPDIPMALTSVLVISFYSVIRRQNSKVKNGREWKSCKTG